MEWIKQKYRLLKKPVLSYDQVKHLLEPPSYDSDSVAPDLQQSTGSQRFELVYSADLHVPPKFLDTTTGKTYHNMDTDIVEERFSNGYYCTPKQFLRDLELIQEDAATIGDRHRKIKANEMLTYAEITIAEVEMDSSFIALCEEMYERQQTNLEETADKIERKQRAIEASIRQVEKVVESAVRDERGSPSGQGEHESGSGASDGTGVNWQPYSHPRRNRNRTGSMQSRLMDPYGSHRGSDSTRILQPPEIEGRSMPTERPLDSNSFVAVPSLSPNASTQRSLALLQRLPFASSPPRGSQPPPTPNRSHRPGIQLPPLPLPSRIIDEQYMASMQRHLCEGTSGYSVEQLEQVHSAMMTCVWQMRTNWNRTEVAEAVTEVFEEIEGEIRDSRGDG
jgi:hypothetical protein